MTLQFLTLEAEWLETQFTLIMMEVGEQVRLEDSVLNNLCFRCLQDIQVECPGG